MTAASISLLPCRICLVLAGLVVASGHRKEWRQEWLSELWHRRQALKLQDAWSARAALALYRTALGCFQDAWCELTSDDERWLSLRMQTRSPAFCAGTLGAVLVCLAMTSGYFPATRTILSGLPYSNGAQLALVSRTGRLESIRRSIPGGLASAWLRRSKLLEAMADVSFEQSNNAEIGGRIFKVSALRGSRNLFDVIGEPLTPSICHSLAAGEPVALLSYAFWQHELHGDTRVIGHRLSQNHRDYLVGAILRPGFWFLSPSVQIYELAVSAMGDRSTLVIRSKPHVAADQLEAELSQTAEQNEIPFTRTAPDVLFLSDAVRTPIWIFAGALLISAVLVMVGHGSRPGKGKHTKSHLNGGHWRWWVFLLLKATLALFLVFTLGIEIFVGLSHQLASEPLGGPALLWFYMAGCSLVLLAIIADQQARCRVCLQCLAFPIRVGCPGCLFLDWSGTELLCPEGHGILYVPHHLCSWDEAERWVALEI